MKAVVFAAPGEVRVDDVPRPGPPGPRDAIVAVRRSAICGSDLHLLSGKTPGMRPGGVIGHEFVGIVDEAGAEVAISEGTRVLGSFLIACGRCRRCAERRFNFCRERRALGLGHLTGDLDGAQAEYVRIPDADANLKPLDGVLEGVDDDHALFGGDILATGFYAVSLCSIEPGDVVAVIGAGPVGLFCALAAQTERPSRVVVLDRDPRRVAFARGLGLEALEPPDDATPPLGADGADVAMEAVGAVGAFKTAMRSVRDGGRVVVVGVYGAERYDLPMGRAWLRALDIRFAGMANVQGHWDDALTAVRRGELDPVKLITHRLRLDDAAQGYELFASREAMKVVLNP